MEIPIHYTPTLPTFFFIFVSVYLLAYLLIFRNWSPKDRPNASSCIISLAHGTPAVILAINAIFQTPHNFAHPNTPFQNTVLEYSIAYFLTDLSHLLLFFPTDILFIAHHLATIFVFATCRYLVCHGAFGILVLLVLAEITSGCQNVWTLSEARKGDVIMAARVHELLSPAFYGFYLVARGVLGPVFVCKMVVFYWSGGGGDVIPMWVWVSWMAVIVTAILVSLLWVLNLVMDLYRERKKVGKKMR